jgi:branched-chain amino acid transport system ATP-binding protein
VSAIELEAVDAGYGRTPVVRSLSLSVAPGEVVALLGPNGAGKTTTLLTIAGLLPALRGTVRALGSAVSSRAPERLARRGLAFVTEDRSLFPGLTVREHLHLAAEDWSSALTWFPKLSELLGRRAGLLSGGEQQMLALARALVARPRALLVDEMSLGLAPLIVRDLAATVRAVADELSIAVLLVEQHVPVALSIADRAVVLRHGRSVLTASAAALLADATILRDEYLGV